MSESKQPSLERRAHTNRDYEVGYCKPPAENRFKEGKSGNPTGRPKKLKPNDDDDAIPVIADAVKILNDKIEITERGRKKRIPLRTAILRQYIHAATKSEEPKVLADLIKLMEKWDGAILEGRGREPLKIIIEGGLPGD